MAHRSFRDNNGQEWDVWEVVPTAVERRMARASVAGNRPVTFERRKTHETRVLVPEKLQRGWLAFQCDTERRRLSPIPDDWADMTSDQLLDLLNRAEHRGRPRRLIE